MNVSFSVGWWIGQYWLKTTTLSGSVPSSVGCRNFTWYWYLDEIGEIELEESLLIATSGSHKHYTLLAAPQSSMSEPWTEVLDYSTGWAEGESSSSGVVEEVTSGIFNDLGDTDGDMDYDGTAHYTIDNDYNFELTSFFSDIGKNSNVKVNCSDVGNIFCIFTRALGVASQNKNIFNDYGFNTKSIDPIGSPGWGTTSWVYHQFGWYNSQVDDASLRVNYGSPILPTNMTQSTYDSYLLAPGNNYTDTSTGVTTLEN